MTPASDDELRELRRRAYGRDPDIHLDPDALKRLHELERSQVVVEPPVSDDVVEIVEPPVEPEPVPPPEPEPRRPPAWVLAFLGWLTGLRRSTVFMAIGALLIAAGILTALTLVQRVQTDPLQVGAVQVARLGADPGYELPEFFAGSESEARAYQGFLGLRPLSMPSGFFAYGSADSTCIAIFSEDATTMTANSFEGPIFTACGAGKFPAMLQFTSDMDDLPEELQSAFPDSTGLQFVYDAENDEVVVFADHE